MVREGVAEPNSKSPQKAGIVPGDEVLKWKLRAGGEVAGMLWGHSTW